MNILNNIQMKSPCSPADELPNKEYINGAFDLNVKE